MQISGNPLYSFPRGQASGSTSPQDNSASSPSSNLQLDNSASNLQLDNSKIQASNSMSLPIPHSSYSHSSENTLSSLTSLSSLSNFPSMLSDSNQTQSSLGLGLSSSNNTTNTSNTNTSTNPNSASQLYPSSSSHLQLPRPSSRDLLSGHSNSSSPANQNNPSYSNTAHHLLQHFASSSPSFSVISSHAAAQSPYSSNMDSSTTNHTTHNLTNPTSSSSSTSAQNNTSNIRGSPSSAAASALSSLAALTSSNMGSSLGSIGTVNSSSSSHTNHSSSSNHDILFGDNFHSQLPHLANRSTSDPYDTLLHTLTPNHSQHSEMSHSHSNDHLHSITTNHNVASSSNNRLDYSSSRNQFNLAMNRGLHNSLSHHSPTSNIYMKNEHDDYKRKSPTGILASPSLSSNALMASMSINHGNSSNPGIGDHINPDSVYDNTRKKRRKDMHIDNGAGILASGNHNDFNHFNTSIQNDLYNIKDNHHILSSQTADLLSRTTTATSSSSANDSYSFDTNHQHLNNGGLPGLKQKPRKKTGQRPMTWTREEEDKLRNLVKAGTKWPQITLEFPNRSAGAIKKHFYADMKHTVWREDEDNALQQVFKEDENNKWRRIGEKLGRPAKACEKRMKELLNMKPGEYISPEQSRREYEEQEAREQAAAAAKNLNPEYASSPHNSNTSPTSNISDANHDSTASNVNNLSLTTSPNLQLGLDSATVSMVPNHSVSNLGDTRSSISSQMSPMMTSSSSLTDLTTISSSTDFHHHLQNGLINSNKTHFTGIRTSSSSSPSLSSSSTRNTSASSTVSLSDSLLTSTAGITNTSMNPISLSSVHSTTSPLSSTLSPAISSNLTSSLKSSFGYQGPSSTTIVASSLLQNGISNERGAT